MGELVQNSSLDYSKSELFFNINREQELSLYRWKKVDFRFFFYFYIECMKNITQDIFFN